jgi:GalNAc-alpha-(1->4)-GalNAc-alpha-(1->3)-diNAcBac-PP-undecaprenol alpha-1,4-N-acetyl-D-galactosaminyltransferase
MVNNTQKHFCFILHSLVGGGMERVMVELANNFVEDKNAKVTFLLLRKNKRFYRLNPQIRVIEPLFEYSNKDKFLFAIKILFYIRKNVHLLKPDVVLSFGEKWNSFNLIALLFTSYKIFVSDRSSPELKLSFVHRILRKVLYKNAHGIIAQTNDALTNIFKITKHKNIVQIGNPIRKITSNNEIENTRENVILNVGRFIRSKQQIQLIEIFARLDVDSWKLVFLGNGPYLEAAKNKVIELGLNDKVVFIGESNNVDKYYSTSKIFAFTSILEGFPNSLGEALNTPLSCISYNCTAGPSDLIINNFNGFLVNNNDIEEYKRKLETLMKNENLRMYFEKNALEKMELFSSKTICNKYYNFLLSL